MLGFNQGPGIGELWRASKLDFIVPATFSNLSSFYDLQLTLATTSKKFLKHIQKNQSQIVREIPLEREKPVVSLPTKALNVELILSHKEAMCFKN